ncbi:zinc ABC transporter ATP-binding protein ZnuC [Cocleimonas flava]|uniref:Zinc transport system ATP-binding protein n=1 Tax=Cocleimonas flava TaxID=634765 RepID=A0A4R1F5P5_9GAMM|nr:zinc ABC transporter ATP-binding protein ZnuC [Cocleimonas flava]TCJ89243.1 zinc transport system ATP-binding protein [Cocleimonas flava]
MSDPIQNKNVELLASLDHINLSLQGKTILHDVSLQLQAGKILTVIGPNGAGKSTLIRILLGLETAQSGGVYRKPKLRIGYVPQKMAIDSLLPLTVERFVSLSSRSFSNTAKAKDALEETGVKHLAKQAIQQLSGGEFQRVLLARALLRKPELLILDEPAQGVDVTGQAELYEQIAALKNTYGFGVLMVSHDLHLVMQKTDQVLCLNQHICCSGQPDDVSKHPEYQRLFGNLPAEGLAVYTHHHNHCHELNGDVVVGECKHADHNHSHHEHTDIAIEKVTTKEQEKHTHG